MRIRGRVLVRSLMLAGMLSGAYAGIVVILLGLGPHMGGPFAQLLMWPSAWLLRHEAVSIQILAASVSVFILAFAGLFGVGCFARRRAK